MEKLYKKLKKYNLQDAINIEKSDRQFLALEKLWTSPQPSPLEERGQEEKAKNYLFLIIINALICYQLSWKWEDYWEEFAKTVSPHLASPKGRGIKDFSEIYNFFEKFIPESKNNRRFIDTKLKRVKKILTSPLAPLLIGEGHKMEYFYKNMDKLVLELSKTMKQKTDAKTIVFAVKMFSYWARNIYNFEYFPENIMIPIDSRLENLYKKYAPLTPFEGGIDNKKIKEFYINLSKKLNIPLLHLDAILWVKYEELME